MTLTCSTRHSAKKFPPSPLERKGKGERQPTSCATISSAFTLTLSLKDRGNRCALLLILAFLLTGCASSEHLPAYHWTTTDQALRDLSTRAHAVHTLSSEAAVTLTRTTGDSVRLDAAVAMRPPDHLRLRAWKFNQSIFDLTLNPSGVYLVSPSDNSLHDKIRAGGISAARLGHIWAVFTSNFFDASDLKVTETPEQLIITSHLGEQSVTCTVDRATLTPRSYTLRDPEQHSRFTLLLSHYSDRDGMTYPHQLTAISDSGKIGIELRDLELNSPLPPNAFTPPRRAEKLP